VICLICNFTRALIHFFNDVGLFHSFIPTRGKNNVAFSLVMTMG